MSYMTKLFSGAGGGGVSSAIMGGFGQEEALLKAETDKYDALTRIAAEEARSLGTVQKNRQEAAIRNPNPWITSQAGALGVRPLAGSTYTMGA